MPTFIIGDIHGKYSKLLKLLKKVQFNSEFDTIWCTGDLVARGKKSLETLQFFQNLDDKVITVMGNHDLYLLALYHGISIKEKPSKELKRILEHPDVDSILNWLSKRPFIHHSPEHKSILIHAGLPPQISLEELISVNKKLQDFFIQPQLNDFLVNHMMGNKPKELNDSLTEYEQYRFFINSLTRMRFCDNDGKPHFTRKHKPDQRSINKVPWFEVPNHKIVGSHQIFFGHWATLTDYPINIKNVYHLDTACAWGGRLTALCLEGCEQRGYSQNEKISISCS